MKFVESGLANHPISPSTVAHTISGGTMCAKSARKIFIGWTSSVGTCKRMLPTVVARGVRVLDRLRRAKGAISTQVELEGRSSSVSFQSGIGVLGVIVDHVRVDFRSDLVFRKSVQQGSGEKVVYH